MLDRVPTKPGRTKMTHDDGTVECVTLERADEPTQEGTPLNKSTLLSDETAAQYGLSGSNAIPDKAFKKLTPYEVGDIILTSRADVSDDWLLCDGRRVDKTEYPKLYQMAENRMGLSSQSIHSHTGVTTRGLYFLDGKYLVLGNYGTSSSQNTNSRPCGISYFTDFYGAPTLTYYVTSYLDTTLHKLGKTTNYWFVAATNGIHWSRDLKTWTHLAYPTFTGGITDIQVVNCGSTAAMFISSKTTGGEYDNYYLNIIKVTETGNRPSMTLVKTTSNYDAPYAAYIDNQYFVVVRDRYHGAATASWAVYDSSFNQASSVRSPLPSSFGAYVSTIKKVNGVYVVGGAYVGSTSSTSSSNASAIVYATSMSGPWTVVKVLTGTKNMIQDIEYSDGRYTICNEAGAMYQAEALKGPWELVPDVNIGSLGMFANGAWTGLKNNMLSFYGKSTPILTSDAGFYYIKGKELI